MSTTFLTDPLWYKDAVIYELHVRSFFDSNDDGFGDFNGLRKKLPYLERLGVNTLWLLPFLESPLKDDGYDTADYLRILPVHGDLDDFKAFMAEAHERGMRVITELVLNHTSDQHPWFQEARDPASPRHDWFVWSETADKYRGVRIIFTDTEVSNWSWDQKAQKYYWHRFFSHQPDLNYDNPDVRQAMKEVMFFWLDLGVDGLRLDAVPYLYEREGTTCENLPETIDYLVELRQAVEERYGPGKVLLAEANQWPEDTLPYFADGEGVQMAFNFPIMPRMYLSLRRENRRPLVEMLELTSNIPEQAQWALFLRNHDELTLEMVTDEERDYMYNEYAADDRFRINVGIRRRLAPLLGGDRSQIELMNALLLSLPGSPILYYGDEIGMGDDPFLGDRNGVRTPMQWSPDKNGGFSRAPHHRLFMPAIHHGPYSYEFVNAEDAETDSNSLLHFTRRLLAFRKQYSGVFGRGTMRVLPVKNSAVFAFIREYEGVRVLVVTNLSRFAQSAYIPPDEDLVGMAPIEMFSRSAFPSFGEDPYHLPLGPHRFYWFALEPADERERRAADRLAPEDDASRGSLPVLTAPEGLVNLVVRTMATSDGIEGLEAILPAFLNDQRWFGAKSEGVESVRVADAVRLEAGEHPIYLSMLEVNLGERRETYLLPLTSMSAEDADGFLADRPRAGLAWLDRNGDRLLICDATALDTFWVRLFNWWQSGGKRRSLKGTYFPDLTETIRTDRAVKARPLTVEQSNSSAIITLESGNSLFAKLYRRLEDGANPEVELLEHLGTKAYRFVPRLLGTARFSGPDGNYQMGMLQEALPEGEDGWSYAVAKVEQFYSRVAGTAALPEDDHSRRDAPAWIEESAPELLELARLLGVRTAEMHAALAAAEVESLRPVEGSAGDFERLGDRITGEMHRTRKMLEEARLDIQISDEDWQFAEARLDELRTLDGKGERIRVHGDYHLGQTHYADGELYLLDFEGEPARPLDERRRPDFAARDVAGMLRSLDYAVRLPLMQDSAHGGDMQSFSDALLYAAETVLLDAYAGAADGAEFLLPDSHREFVLWAYLIDKALYEIRYELNHRPSWASLPVSSLRRLLQDAAAGPSS